MPSKRQRTSDDTNGNHANGNGHLNRDAFVAAEDINDDPDRVKFAYV